MENDNGKEVLRVRVGHSRAGAIATIVMGVLFLAFGAALFSETQEHNAAILLFQGIWYVSNLALIGWGVYSLVTGKPVSPVEIEIEKPKNRQP